MATTAKVNVFPLKIVLRHDLSKQLFVSRQTGMTSLDGKTIKERS